MKEFFEEVQLGFLVVSHTHEDIDGSFSYLLKNLKYQNNYVLVDLMKAFMVSQERSFILQLIQ
jgi:beta-lactamase superfamily II metal-dependent hydrolase